MTYHIPCSNPHNFSGCDKYAERFYMVKHAVCQPCKEETNRKRKRNILDIKYTDRKKIHWLGGVITGEKVIYPMIYYPT